MKKQWLRTTGFVFLVILVVVLVVFVWAYSQVVGFRSVTGYYENTHYQYALTMPAGWRLGTFLMLLLNPLRFGNRPTNDETVVVTDLDRAGEWDLGRAINDDQSANRLSDYKEFLSGQTILIQAERSNLDPSQLLKPGSAVTGLPIRDVHPVQVRSDSGMNGWRYELSNEPNDSSSLLIVWFPYPTQMVASSGDPFTGISIRTVEDQDYNEQMFESIYRSVEFGSVN